MKKGGRGGGGQGGKNGWWEGGWEGKRCGGGYPVHTNGTDQQYFGGTRQEHQPHSPTMQGEHEERRAADANGKEGRTAALQKESVFTQGGREGGRE